MTGTATGLENLTVLSLIELHGAWRRYYATEVPATMSRELLQRAIGYKMQEEAFGGLNRRTLLRLKALTIDRQTARGRTANKSLHATPTLKSGTKLIREWQGQVHEVMALEDGRFAYAGKSYRSLTLIAHKITGTHWSGPRFFGLKKARGAVDG